MYYCLFRDGNEDVLSKLEMLSELSEKMLLRFTELKRPFYVIPTMEVFHAPNEFQPLSCHWWDGHTVSSAEFISQVFID